jgi:hypothetical protein
MSRRVPMMNRRVPILFALLVALAASVTPAIAPAVRAAAPDLTLTADTRYDVDPDQQRIHVTATLTAVNHLKDTKTRLYYFDTAYLHVQPGATGFKITARTGAPKVRVVQAKADYTRLRIDFGKRLPAGSSRTFTLTFDIPDKGGAPTRDVRVGASLVTFGAWAFASESTPGGSVTVAFPPGYNVEVQTGEIGGPKTDEAGRTIFSSGRLTDPLGFFAYFIADRPNAYTETTRPVEVDGRPLDIAIRAWPDDPAWGERVGGLLERGVPVLSERIGLPWVADRPLVVAEAISRSTAGYSGKYEPTTGRIEIAYYADSFVVLHEAAHAWFNGSLLADRWANEGFASWYALDTATAIEEKVAVAPLTPELTGSRIPLNAWGPVGSNEPVVEDYGYAASAELARLIAERAGPTGLASVWNAVRRGIGAYQPAGLAASNAMAEGSGAMAGPGNGSDTMPTEAGSGPPDWRGLLDLLEDRTGKKYDDLWRAWVVRHEEASLLDNRAAARRQYDDVASRAGEWSLPPIVRQAMRAWQFEQATELLDAADRALDDRDAVMSAAAAANLSVPHALEAAFESDTGFAAAAAEADAQLVTIDAYRKARDARPPDPGIVEQVGLWWTTPEIDIANAADAYAVGDLRESVRASSAARVAWESASDTGRSRLMTILAATLVALVLVGFLVSWVRGLRMRRTTRRTMAHPAARGRP